MNDLELAIWNACREADESFEKAGAAGTKEWIREYLFPALKRHELVIQRKVDVDAEGDGIATMREDLRLALLQKRVVETHLQDLVEAIDRNHHATKGGTRLDGHGPCEVCSIIERGAQKSKP